MIFLVQNGHQQMKHDSNSQTILPVSRKESWQMLSISVLVPNMILTEKLLNKEGDMVPCHTPWDRHWFGLGWMIRVFL